MAAASGAPVSSSAGDPVLDEALSEMQSEGTLGGGSDPGTDSGASQQDEVGGAAAQAGDDSSTTGDDGSVETLDAPAKGTDKEAAPAKEGELGAEAGDDPLKGTEPFSYTVNGEKKTLEGVLRVPGEGLLVPEDRVQAIEQLAARADNLDRVTREYQSQNQEYERLSRWIAPGPDGKDQTFEGPEGLVQMRVQFGRLAASYDTIVSLVKDPQRLLNLLTVGEDGSVSSNREALEHLLTTSDLAEMKAEQFIRSQITSSATPSASPSRQADGSSSASWAPQVIEAAAKSAGIDSKTLTEKDRSFLASLLPRYVRAVTQDDRRMNPALKVGAQIVDASFTNVLKDRADLRSEATKQAAASEKAGKFNAGQDKGRQPAAGPKKAVTKPAEAKPADKPRRKSDWDAPLEDALAEMGIR